MAAGLNKYTVQEGVNAQLGQGGFDCFVNGAEPSNTEGTWVALQALTNVETGIVLVHAECSTGNNLSSDGGTGKMSIKNGEIVYGPFNKLVSASIAAGESLLAYRG
jgi:hypothetical protein